MLDDQVKGDESSLSDYTEVGEGVDTRGTAKKSTKKSSKKSKAKSAESKTLKQNLLKMNVILSKTLNQNLIKTLKQDSSTECTANLKRCRKAVEKNSKHPKKAEKATNPLAPIVSKRCKHKGLGWWPFDASGKKLPWKPGLWSKPRPTSFGGNAMKSEKYQIPHPDCRAQAKTKCASKVVKGAASLNAVAGSSKATDPGLYVTSPGTSCASSDAGNHFCWGEDMNADAAVPKKKFISMCFTAGGFIDKTRKPHSLGGCGVVWREGQDVRKGGPIECWATAWGKKEAGAIGPLVGSKKPQGSWWSTVGSKKPHGINFVDIECSYFRTIRLCACNYF